MRALGNSDIPVDKCGFTIHSEKGWLGASPDGRVKGLDSDGIVEIKCPYSKREVSPEDACGDSSFYCELINSEVRLKQTHAYYHQVQLQLFVGIGLYHWCDFCVYTCKGFSVQRIFPNNSWQERYIPKLESYFDDFILLEIVTCKYKPTYVI